MANKKYYWLKLKEDFFRQKEIKKLRKVAGGDTYTVIYLKMLLLAIKNDNKIYFDGVEDDFAEELALELDEETDNVKMTLAFLQNQRLIETINEDEYLLPQCKSMTGVESASAERVRRHRLKQKEEQKTLQCNTHVTSSNKNVTTETETELETEIELEIEQQHRERGNEICSVVVEKINEYFNLEKDEIKIVASAHLATGKDISYLIEKLELVKNTPGVKSIVGFLLKAIENDYKVSMSKDDYKKTKFHNFDETFTQYEPDELYEIIEKAQAEKWKDR